MPGPGKYVFSGPNLHNPAHVHHGDPIGDMPYYVQVMGYKQVCESQLLL